MKGAIGGLRTEAPTPSKPWQIYATNSGTGKLEWFFSVYSSHEECAFEVEKSLRVSRYYRKPAGCLYSGYQNPFIQWIANTVVGAGMFKCIARTKEREKYDDPVYSPVLRDFPSDHSDTWACVL
jgi:hypothetical protein